MRILALLVGGMLLGGCASTLDQKENVPLAQHTREASSRIYTIAENQAEHGEYANAVLLLRHAILQLPETEANDELRHDLVLRMAYVELLAFESSGDPRFAEDAARMLNAYVVRHTALFPEGEKAKAARGEVYELLYEVEEALEPSDDPEDAATGPSRSPGAATKLAAHTVDDPVDIHAGEEVDERMQRKVRVRKQRLADPNDARVRQRLESSFSDSTAGFGLTSGGVAQVHGPRPLVRASRFPSHVDAEAPPEERRLARKLGFQLIRASRTDLRDCYASAFARSPTAVTHSTIEASIDADGNVIKPKIVSGGVVDGLGDVCVIEKLAAAEIDPEASRPGVRLQMELVFFYEGAKTAGIEPLSRPSTRIRAMSGSDEFAKPSTVAPTRRRPGIGSGGRAGPEVPGN